jgi:hypothetical protein
VFGWIWATVVQLTWLGVAAAYFGDLEAALDKMKGLPWLDVAVAGFVTSSLAAWIGGVAGPMLLGPVVRTRRPILVGSAVGGAACGLVGAGFGTTCSHLMAPLRFGNSDILVAAILGLAVPAGILGGWAASYLLADRRAEPED